MRVFKAGQVARWARKERISDKALCEAAEQIVAGQVEGDLGDWLFKKRIARPGAGKSGGYRTVVGYRRRHSDRVVFLFGFAKNQSSNITEAGHKALAKVARSLILATDEEIAALLAAKELVEVRCREGRD